MEKPRSSVTGRIVKIEAKRRTRARVRMLARAPGRVPVILAEALLGVVGSLRSRKQEGFPCAAFPTKFALMPDGTFSR